MRKVAFTSGHDSIRKVMLYECPDGVYVFGYDCVQDTSSISDYLYETLEDAEDFCKEEYNIHGNWIPIADPLNNCQHDFIMPTRVKTSEDGNPGRRDFQTLIDGRWIDIGTLTKTQSFEGMTVNERLLVSGLLGEFDRYKSQDETRVKQILHGLGVERPQ